MSSVSTDTYNDTGAENDLLPDDIDYTNADVDRDVARPRLRANTLYRGKVTNARTRVWNKGSIYFEMNVNPLDAEGKTRSPSTKYKLTLPFANPKKAGHTAPNTIGFWHQFLNATYPTKFPTFPTRSKDGTWTTADGTVVNQVQADQVKKDIVKSIRDQIKVYFRNPAELVDEVFYFTTKDDDYREIDRVYSEPPSGMEVRLSDFGDVTG